MNQPTILSFWELLINNILTFMRRIGFLVIPEIYKTFKGQPILMVIFGIFILNIIVGMYKKL